MPADLAAGRADVPPYGTARGVLITVEGIWGTGKTTTATALGERLTAAGFSTSVMHYGRRHGVVQHLSHLLDTAPLRRRDGLGGYAAAHHATVDVLLRLSRESFHHRVLYRPALAEHDVVIIDHGVYSKLAYALAVLSEQHPGVEPALLLDQVRAVAAPWFLHPDVALWLDMPWPLARERAVARRVAVFDVAFGGGGTAGRGAQRRLGGGRDRPAGLVPERLPDRGPGVDRRPGTAGRHRR